MPEIPRWHWGDPVEPLVRCLAAGGILAIPTESSYALAVDPRSTAGVESIREIKGRERGKALPVVVANVEQALELGVRPDSPELEVLEALWPAPLTAVLRLANDLPASAGRATLAVRVPAHPRIRQLLHDVECPLTATSANRRGESPVLEPAALEPLLMGRVAIIVDEGRLPGGTPSTLVEWSGGRPRILRVGAYNPELLPTLPPSLPPALSPALPPALPYVALPIQSRPDHSGTCTTGPKK